MQRPAAAIALTIGSLSAGACLFPDYRTVEEAAGTGGTGTGAAAGTGGAAGTGNSSGSGGTIVNGDSGPGGSGGVMPCADASGADGCAPSGERCDNGLDDDSNGKVDCFDAACATDAACAGYCFDAAPLSCATVRIGENSGAGGSTNRIGPPAYGCSGTDRVGPEYAYHLTPVPGQNVFVQAYALQSDLGLFLIDVPSGAPCDATTACTAYSDQAATASELLSFVPQADHDYYVVVDGAEATGYSLNVQCMPSGGCMPAVAIEAGQTISGSTTLGLANVTDNLLTYSCLGINHYGPEAAYLFTPAQSGTYEAQATNLSTNLALFVLGGTVCIGTCLDSGSYSDSAAAMPESVTFDAVADTSYYIIVDSFTSGSFDLSVTQL